MKNETRSAKPSGLASGWILVTGLLLLCVTGTWLTAHNYKQHVFSSARGIVLENQWPESRISVVIPLAEASKIISGHHALVTMESTGEDGINQSNLHALKGEVVSVSSQSSEAKNVTVIVRLLEDPGNAGNAGDAAAVNKAGKPRHFLPVGAPCGVTIDTTIPPDTIPPDHVESSGAK
jgi:hypothetical protein